MYSKSYANDTDYCFLKGIMNSSEAQLIPEYNGFNTRMIREGGRLIGSKSRYWFKPLLNMRPADPSCIKTSMILAVRETEKTGQEYTIFTADQQLYKVTVDVSWNYPLLFPKHKFIIRLGECISQ